MLCVIFYEILDSLIKCRIFFFPEDFSITECSDASVSNPYGEVKQSHFFEEVTSRAGNRIQVCVCVVYCHWHML